MHLQRAFCVWSILWLYSALLVGFIAALFPFVVLCVCCDLLLSLMFGLFSCVLWELDRAILPI